MSGAVFLSAGVPDPTADHFIGAGDSAAIAAAVSAVLSVTLGRRRLVWGGHPSITPMVWTFAETMQVDYRSWVKLYQSKYFEDLFPEENAAFQNVVITPVIDNDRDRSLRYMRELMLSETKFDAAVFIGGMGGVLEEYSLFAARVPNARIVPIASTGGAAAQLYGVDSDPSLASELDYLALLYRQLAIDPNERRYQIPEQQPETVAERLHTPGHH